MVKRTSCTIKYASQQVFANRQMPREIGGTAARRLTLSDGDRGAQGFGRRYARTGNQALHIILRHQEQSVARKAHHFRLDAIAR